MKCVLCVGIVLTMLRKNYSTGTLDKYFYMYYYKEPVSSVGGSVTTLFENKPSSKTEPNVGEFLPPSTHKTVLWDQSSLIDHQCDENNGSDVDSIISIQRESSKVILWQQLPEVIDSGILNRFSTTRVNLQEAVFEVITTEAKYLRKLRILVNHFVIPFSKFSQDGDLITTHDWKYLFELVDPVKQASERYCWA